MHLSMASYFLIIHQISRPSESRWARCAGPLCQLRCGHGCSYKGSLVYMYMSIIYIYIYTLFRSVCVYVFMYVMYIYTMFT